MNHTDTDSSSSQSPEHLEPASPQRRPRLRGVLELVLGLLVGLCLAEGIAWLWDDGAFPHANFYVADQGLGVRLEPGATERIKLGENPLTHVRINAQGYRGADFPPVRGGDGPGRPGAGSDGSSPGEIVVVGDSQVFGLGVEEDETFAAQLARVTGRPVINAGVPTNGPLEYNAVAAELLEARHPATLVYVVNFANDLFENDRPNRERHRVWDGWAVRAETGPESISRFPGRELLFRKSHLIYALRRFLYQAGAPLEEQGFPSEGSWKEVVRRSDEAGQQREAHPPDGQADLADRQARKKQLEVQLKQNEDEVDRLLFKAFPELRGSGANVRLRAARGNPGDIVTDHFSEAARSITLTAELIRSGAEYRERLETQLRLKHSSEALQLKGRLSAREALKLEEEQLEHKPVASSGVPSVLEPRLREVKAVCDRAGARLLVVALPLDVQVSSGEWSKYGVKNGADMGGTRSLLRDLVQSAEGLGAQAIDVTDALIDAEPGAFLVHDLHMTPKGHAAVGEALARKLGGKGAGAGVGGGMEAGKGTGTKSETGKGATDGR